MKKWGRGRENREEKERKVGWRGKESKVGEREGTGYGVTQDKIIEEGGE